jgi:hypothetical protein
MSLDPKDRDTPIAVAVALRRSGDAVSGAKILRETINANAGPDEWVRWCDLAAFLVESDALPAAE